MSTVDDIFGSESSGNEFDPVEEAGADGTHEDDNDGGAGSSGVGADPLEDSDDGNKAAEVPSAAMRGTGLSDSEDEEEQEGGGGAGDGGDVAKQAMDVDVFGSDSEDDIVPAGGSGGSAGADGVDPFEDSDEDGGRAEAKTLRIGGGRLSKGGNSGKGKEKLKGRKRKAGAEGSISKKPKSKSDEGGNKKAAAKKKKKKRKRKNSQEGEGEEDGEKKQARHKKKKGKKTEAKASSVENSTLQDLGLESSADEAADEDEDDDDEGLSDAEVEHEDEEEGVGDDTGERAAGVGDARTEDDEDFIDNSDDNADILAEYKQDEPQGDHEEAEEDNGQEAGAPKRNDAMAEVLASMKKRKAQDLSTSEREQIAQEFMFKINQAAEDDEEAVQAGRPALNKIKMLKTVRATLAKKELQETFLEFDLLGVVKRWLQPYSNGQLPNLLVRKEMLQLMLNLPVQVDHLKRSGIGKVVMGLLNCKEETTQNKRTLRELVSRWNRPVYEKETNYRARRPAHDDLEAMEVRPRGAAAAAAATDRRMVSGSGSMSQRKGPSKNEAVGNILNARAAGPDPTQSRVPFSNGYAFSKAPRSRVEERGRAPGQQVDTSTRAKLLKKMATLSRPISKSG